MSRAGLFVLVRDLHMYFTLTSIIYGYCSTKLALVQYTGTSRGHVETCMKHYMKYEFYFWELLHSPYSGVFGRPGGAWDTRKTRNRQVRP